MSDDEFMDAWRAGELRVVGCDCCTPNDGLEATESDVPIPSVQRTAEETK